MRKIFVLVVLFCLQSIVYAEGAWEPATLPVFPYPGIKNVPYQSYDVNGVKLYAIDLDILEGKYGRAFLFEEGGEQNYNIRLGMDYEIVGDWEAGLGQVEYIKVLVWNKDNPNKKYGVICEKIDNKTKIAGVMFWYIYRTSENVIQRHGRLLIQDDINSLGGNALNNYYKKFNIIKDDAGTNDILKSNGFSFYYANDKSVIINDYNGSGGTVTIPEKINNNPVTSIDEKAFFHKNLTNIIFPSSLKTIGKMAFTGNSLTNIKLPQSLTRIEYGAFSSNKLTELTLPNSIVFIASSAFIENAIKTLVLPQNITSIESGTFMMNKLTSVTIPAKVKKIGYQAFEDNPLVKITIGENVQLEVKSWGKGAFPNGFDDFYNSNGKKAGTYTYSEGKWTIGK